MIRSKSLPIDSGFVIRIWYESEESHLEFWFLWIPYTNNNLASIVLTTQPLLYTCFFYVIRSENHFRRFEALVSGKQHEHPTVRKFQFLWVTHFALGRFQSSYDLKKIKVFIIMLFSYNCHFQILLREYVGSWENPGGSHIFVFYCIFMTKFFEVFWEGTWGALFLPLPPPPGSPPVCIYGCETLKAAVPNIWQMKTLTHIDHKKQIKTITVITLSDIQRTCTQ